MSANIIDSLFVSLGLDATAFKKGAKDSSADLDKFRKESEAAAKKVEAAGKQAANFFGEVRNQALAMAAVFLGGLGLKEFAQQVTTADAATGRLASNLGISTEELSEWEGAAKRAGGSAEGMDSSLKTISSALQKFDLTGEMDGPLALFYQLGIRFQDAQGKALPLKNIMMEISSVLAKQSPQRATEISKMLGFDEGTGNLLRMGPTQIQALMDRQRELYEVTQRDADAAMRLANKWQDMKDAATGVGQKILTDLEPALEKVLDGLIGIEQWAQRNPRTAEFIFGGFVIAATAASTLISGIWLTSILRSLGLASAGFSTLGIVAKGSMIAIAGAVGYAAGSFLYDKGIAGTSFGDFLGSLTHGFGLFHESADPGVAAQMYHGRAATPAAAGAAPGGDSSLPRGIRNNNPGNIEAGAFASSHGATGTDGRFAIFPTMAAGQAAQEALLSGYLGKGYDTISKVINRYAPSSENNTAAYIADVSKQLGVGADAQLNTEQVGALSRAMEVHENGSKYASTIMGGIGRSGAGQTAMANSTSSSEVNIQTINVQTAATDADGVARDLKQAISTHSLVAQANTGIQ